jgi:hypothetical protein
MIPTIKLLRVPVRKLHSRIKGYDLLFDVPYKTHLIKVSGHFLNQRKELIDLSTDFYPVDPKLSKGIWLYVEVGLQEWEFLRPYGNIIEAMTIAVFQ